MLHNLRQDRTLRHALAIYFIVHFLLIGWMWLVTQIIPFSTQPDQVFRPYMGIAPDQRPFISVWQRWDVLHYQAIAAEGYDAFENSLFVTPLFPSLMRWGGGLLGGDTLVAGYLIANVFSFFALLAIGRLAEDLFDNPETTWRVVLFFGIFPTAFFMHAPYTEPLFLLGAIKSLHKLWQKNWIEAGAWGFLAAFARLPGALILFPLSWIAIQELMKNRNWRALYTPLLTGLGTLIFPIYFIFFLGRSPTAPWVDVNARYSGSTALPFWNVYLTIREIFTGPFPRANLVDLIFMLIAIVGAILVWRRLPTVFSLYYFGFLLAYSVRVAEYYPLLSMPRYALSLFPFFLVLGEWAEQPWKQRLVVYSSFLGLLFLSGQFAIWGWVA